MSSTSRSATGQHTHTTINQSRQNSPPLNTRDLTRVDSRLAQLDTLSCLTYSASSKYASEPLVSQCTFHVYHNSYSRAVAKRTNICPCNTETQTQSWKQAQKYASANIHPQGPALSGQGPICSIRLHCQPCSLAEPSWQIWNAGLQGTAHLATTGNDTNETDDWTCC